MLSGTLRLILGLLMTTATASAQTIVPLWDGPAPQSHGTTPDDIPSLTVFLPANSSSPTSAIVICPGGGYGNLAFDHEGINEAKWLQARGVAGLVLRYRLPSHGYRHPVPMLDVQRAIRIVRSHATDWKINPAKVGIMGFSAGGHLASTAETHFDAGVDTAKDPVERLSCRPDFGILVYPIISMDDKIAHLGSKENLLGPNPDPATVLNLSNEMQVTPQTPPTVLVYAIDDNVVKPDNSKAMYAALQKAGVPSAIQEYSKGGHGFGFGHVPDKAPAGWLERAYDWVKSQGFAP